MHMPKRFCFVPALFFLVFTSPLSAQYGQIIELVAGKERVMAADAIRFWGCAAGTLSPETRGDDIQRTLEKANIRLPRITEDTPITYGKLSYLIVQLYDIPGDFSSGIIRCPRNAFRSMKRLSYLPEKSRSGYYVSGPDMILILRRLEMLEEGTQ